MQRIRTHGFPAALAGLVLIAGSSGAAAQDGAGAGPGWQTYSNPQFGFTMEYPAALFGPPSLSEREGSVTFRSGDGAARLLIFAGENAGGRSPGTIARELSTEDDIGEVTYRRVTDDWIVLSGYLQGSRDGVETIFYQRVEISGDDRTLSGFRIEYPATRRSPFDDLVARMGRSLTPPRG